MVAAGAAGEGGGVGGHGCYQVLRVGVHPVAFAESVAEDDGGDGLVAVGDRADEVGGLGVAPDVDLAVDDAVPIQHPTHPRAVRAAVAAVDDEFGC